MYDGPTQRALELLEEKIGSKALANLTPSRGYKIQSKWWPQVFYVVPVEPNQMTKVLVKGSLVAQICLVSACANLPWPDILLQKIIAIETDETILFQRGVYHMSHKGLSLFERWNPLFRSSDSPVYTVPPSVASIPRPIGTNRFIWWLGGINGAALLYIGSAFVVSIVFGSLIHFLIAKMLGH